jgi:hypothetical protein
MCGVHAWWPFGRPRTPTQNNREDQTNRTIYTYRSRLNCYASLRWLTGPINYDRARLWPVSTNQQQSNYSNVRFHGGTRRLYVIHGSSRHVMLPKQGVNLKLLQEKNYVWNMHASAYGGYTTLITVQKNYQHQDVRHI